MTIETLSPIINIIGLYCIVQLLITMQIIFIPLISSILIFIILSVMVESFKEKFAIPTWFAWSYSLALFIIFIIFIILVLIPLLQFLINDFTIYISKLSLPKEIKLPYFTIDLHTYNLLKYWKPFLNFFNKNILFPFINFGNTLMLTVLFLILLINEHKRVESVFPVLKEVNKGIAKYIKIKTFCSIITGILTTMVLFMLNVQFIYLWGFIAFLLNYIPNFGSMIAVFFPVIYIGLIKGINASILPLILLFLIQFIIGNYLEPLWLGDTLELSPLAIMFFLIFFGVIWGVIGMIISVPLTLIIREQCKQIKGMEWISTLLSSN